MDISLLFNIFKKSPQSPDKTEKNRSFYGSVYPESVRYAFKYRGAEMGKTEMRALLRGWLFEVAYLLMKALA